MAGDDGYKFIDGVPGLAKVLKVSNILTSVDNPIIIQQGATGLRFEDTSSTNQITITHDGTNIVKSKVTSTDVPIETSNYPQHIILEGADAPLDFPGSSYSDGIVYIKYDYDQTGGSPPISSNTITGLKIEMNYDSTDGLTQFPSGILKGSEIFVTAADSLAEGTFGEGGQLYGQEIRVNCTGADCDNHILLGQSIGFGGVVLGDNCSGTGLSVGGPSTGASTTMSSFNVSSFSVPYPNSSPASTITDTKGVYIRDGGQFGASCTIGTRAFLDIDSLAGATFNGDITTNYFIKVGNHTSGGPGSVTTSYSLYIEEDTFPDTAYEVFLADGAGLYFRDSALNITSSADGDLDINADVTLNINTPDIDATGADIICNAIGLGDDTPSGLAFLEYTDSSSAELAVIYALLTYTGAASACGSFQVSTTAAGSATTVTTYGGLFNAYVDDASVTAHTLASTYGGDFVSGFASGSAFTGGGYINAALRAQCFPASAVGGTHTGGTVYGYGLIVSAISRPTGVSSFNKFGIHSAESIEVLEDVPICFDAGALTNGDTKIYYESSSSDLVFEHDGSEYMRANDINVGLAGTAPSTLAVMKYNQSTSTARALFDFDLTYTGNSVIGTISCDTVYQGTATNPAAYSTYSTMKVDSNASGTGNYHASFSQNGIDASRSITQGIHHIMGHTINWSGDGTSHSGGTLYRKGLKIGSFGSISGVSSDTVFGIDTAEDIVLRDDVALVLGGSNTSKNTTNQIYYDSTDTRGECDGTFHFNDRVSGTSMLVGGGDNGNIATSAYLKGFNGQLYTATKGFIAPRDGSIVAISTSLNVSVAGGGTTAQAFARVNGSNTLGTGTISTATTGDKSGYATSTRGTHTFSAGDCVVPYASISGTVMTNDWQCWIEIVFDD